MDSCNTLWSLDVHRQQAVCLNMNMNLRNVLRGLGLLQVLLLMVAAWAQQPLSAPAGPDGRQVAPASADTPAAVFATAQEWQQRGEMFPEALLRAAVERAFQDNAPWSDAEAAIRAFDLYQHRAWAAPAMAPFVSRYATTFLLNAPHFARLHRAWTLRTIERTALRTPAFVLSDLKTLAAVDVLWAKTLAEAAARAVPAEVFHHTATLLEVDQQWTQGILQRAARAMPRQAIQAVRAYASAPWGEALFTEAVLHDPRWVVNLAAFPAGDVQAIMEALQRSTSPHLQVLRRLADSDYPEEVRARTAIFVHDIVDGHYSLAEAAQLSTDTQQYFRALVAMKLAHPERSAVELALIDQVLAVIEPINAQFEQPATRRFRAVETSTARELYILIVYSADTIFTSSYLGLFDRLRTRMQQENLSGDQLLTQVHELQLHVFMKSLASFRRLEAFLATLPSPVARLALLARCLQHLNAPDPETMTRALTAAEIVAADLDSQSLRLLRDVILNEYFLAQHDNNLHAMAIYGLLAAWLGDRQDAELRTATLVAITARYREYLPNFTVLPTAKLFPQGHNLQQYFFYNDEDGKLSFNSFLAQYRSATPWKIADHETYVHLHSHTQGRSMDIYANKPEHAPTGEHSLAAVLQAARLVPTVVVHRGHSPYVDDTIAAIPSTAVLVFLGNCGSYAQLDAVLTQAPQAHIITTKGIGTMTVNDPLLKALNDAILHGQNLVWGTFWKHLEATFGHNPRFLDYVPPDQNASIIFLRAYRSLMTSQTQQAP